MNYFYVCTGFRESIWHDIILGTSKSWKLLPPTGPQSQGKGAILMEPLGSKSLGGGSPLRGDSYREIQLLRILARPGRSGGTNTHMHPSQPSHLQLEPCIG